MSAAPTQLAPVDSEGQPLDEHRASKREVKGILDEYFEVKRAAPPGPQPDLHKEPLPEIRPTDQVPEPEPEAEPEPKVEPKRAITPTAPTDTRPSEVPPEEFAPTGDEEIDKYELGRNTRKESKSQFHNVKQLWHQDRSKLKTAETELEQTRAELERLKTQGGSGQVNIDDDPRVKHANEVLRTLDIQNWPTYQAQFIKPITDKWNQAVDIVGDALGAQSDPVKKEWAEKLRQAGPDALSKEWWQNQLKEIPDEDDRAEVRSILRSIQSLKRERDRFAQENSGPEKYKEFRQKSDEEYTQAYYKDVLKAADELETELGIGEWGKPKDASKAKTDDEKAAVEAHNQRFAGYQKQFVDFMALSTKPETPAKDRTRLCMLAVQALHQKGEMDDLNKQIKTLTERNKVLEAQLNKTMRARSAPDTRGGAPSPRATTPPLTTHRNGSTSAERAKSAMDEYFEKGKYGNG